MDLYKIRNELNMGVPLSNIKLRVTDYVRVSTDSLEQKKSLNNQKEHFYEYIKSNPNWTYVKGYIDDGISGTSDIKRDNFMKMKEDASRNKFDLIITKEISRFSRNTLDSIKYTRELLSYGVAVLFVNDNINTALSDSELRLTIMASMAQDEVRRLSERVKFGMKRAIKNGEILGNDMMYGYKKDKINNTLKIVEKEASIVRKIYEMYTIDNLSLTKIVKKLNELNIKTSFNNKWSVSTISRMIENPKYKGYYCANKTHVVDYMTKRVDYLNKNKWIIYKDNIKVPPIISEELWQRANILLNKRKKKINKKLYLYSNKIYCKNDKSLFYRRIFRKNNKDVTWVCSGYLKKGKKYCDSPNIRESELNKIMYDLIDNLNIDFKEIEEILLKNYNYYENDDTNKKEKLENKIKYLNLKKEKILELNLENSLSNKEFKNKNSELNNEILELKNKLNHLNSKNKINYKQKLNNKINNINKEKIINLILKYIEVYKIDNIINLDIYLNYKNEIYLNKEYKFKRGYDTKSTKRYNVFYKISVYFVDN